MDSDEELDLMLLAVLLIKKQKRRKRKIWVKEIYKNLKTFGIDGLVREMHTFLLACLCNIDLLCHIDKDTF